MLFITSCVAETNCEKDIAIDIRNPNENDEFYDENNDFYDEGSFETMALGKRFYSHKFILQKMNFILLVIKPNVNRLYFY